MTTNTTPPEPVIGRDGLDHYAAAPQPSAFTPSVPPAGLRVADLTPAERTALKEAASSGFRSGNALRETWRKIHTAPATGSPQHDGSQSATATPDHAAALGEALGDPAAGAAMFEQLTPRLERVTQRLASASADEVEAGWQKVTKAVYRGSTEAQIAGVAQIAKAARQIGGEALVEQLEDGGVLGDADVHLSLLNLARQILKGGRP